MSGSADEQGQRLAMMPVYPPGSRDVGGDLDDHAANRPAGIDGSSPEFNGALTQVLEAIGGLNAQLAAVTDHRSGKLHADALAAVISQVASIVGDMAAELATIEDALKEEAHTASRYGVKIGIDGQPPPVLAGPSAGSAAANEWHWALTYRRAFEQAMAAARQARKQAARQLMDVCATIDPPQSRWLGLRRPGPALVNDSGHSARRPRDLRLCRVHCVRSEPLSLLAGPA
ncbi:MAG TPA: hypothetical protein VED20_16285 [Streptosporangiaceae bacterium]|nr:hypothetical protein [Streptosporangiaceae bacterium]